MPFNNSVLVSLLKLSAMNWAINTVQALLSFLNAIQEKPRTNIVPQVKYKAINQASARILQTTTKIMRKAYR